MTPTHGGRWYGVHAIATERLSHIKPERSSRYGVGAWSPGIEILVVCTANRCRSPMAAAIVSASCSLAGVEAQVNSAGTRTDGQPAMREAVEALTQRGLALERLESRRLTAADVAGADLVLGMAREHVRDAVMLAPAAWPRSFTLKELVRRGGLAGGHVPNESLDTWLTRVGSGRRTADLLGADPADDVADPIARPLAKFLSTADELASLARRLAQLISGR